MTKVISISIPDELHERLEQYKKDLNMSQLFREKVEEVLASKERIKNQIRGEVNMKQVLKRWDQEDKADKEEGYKKGQVDGLEWASNAARKELKYLCEVFDPFGQWNHEGLFGDKVVGEHFEQMFDEDENLGYEGEGLTDYNAYTRAWFDGFLEAARKFYDEALMAYEAQRNRR